MVGGLQSRKRCWASECAYLDLRIVSHGLVRCATTLPIDPTWEMLRSKRFLREASHGIARGRARARTRPDIVGVVSCRGLEGGLAASVKGVWFIAHQCACFAVEAPALGYHQLDHWLTQALTVRQVARLPGTWSTQVLLMDVHRERHGSKVVYSSLLGLWDKADSTAT